MELFNRGNKMKTFQAYFEEELTPAQKKYQEFFDKALEKFDVKSPADFETEEKKKEFFDYIKKNYKGND